jgi:hypothetical protein
MQTRNHSMLYNIAAACKARGVCFLIISLIFMGAWMRTITIDRGAPALGLIVYAGALIFFIGMIAVPTGAVGALFAQRLLRGHFSNEIVRQSLATTAALIVFALHHIGHRPAPWQVWLVMSALAFLAARSAYAMAYRTLRQDSEDARVPAALHEGFNAQQAISRAAGSGYLLERGLSQCAGDERNLKVAWRQLPLRKQLSKLDADKSGASL